MTHLFVVFPGLFGANGLTLPHVDYTAILPELILLGGVLLLLGVSGLISRPLPTEAYATATISIAIASLIASLILYHDVEAHGAFTAVASSIDVDGFSTVVLTLVSSILIVAAMAAPGYLRREGVVGPEYYVLALISGSGAMLMGASNDLILIFLALEILSIPLYVMAGFDQRREASGEAAMKYFVLGAFSSAIFVYGIALVYGATGSTNLAQIGAFLARNVITSDGVLLVGMALLIVGFGFKVAAVPFHMWTPDVYAGSPTPAVGFMAAVAKVGGFAALFRVLVSTMPTLASSWQPIVWALAAASLLLGAVVALAQRDIKRMLAYSSINHAGFILLGVQAASGRGVSSSIYYLFAYSFLVLGSFIVITIVGGRGDERHDLEDYRGLARRSPVLATAFALLLLAQAGVPFTTGFFAKLYVLEAASAAHSYALAVLAMVSAAIAVFFYLRVVLTMYSEPPSTSSPGERGAPQESGTLLTATRTVTIAERLVMGEGAFSPWLSSGLFLCVATTVVFGIWPEPLVSFANTASLLFH